jgi:hypothetical protein
MGVRSKTISWQEIMQLKVKANIDMIKKYLPNKRLPIVH